MNGLMEQNRTAGTKDTVLERGGLLQPTSVWFLGLSDHQWLEPIGCIPGACLCLVLSLF